MCATITVEFYLSGGQMQDDTNPGNDLVRIIQK